MEERSLEPDLVIVDPHHHLWDRRPKIAGAQLAAPLPRTGTNGLYLLDELIADMRCGHNVVATVHVEASFFYRADGPEPLRPLGETEAVNGFAAQTASGFHGNIRACAGIVGRVDLTLGDEVVELMQAHVAAGGGRFRGIRNAAAHDDDPAVIGPTASNPPGLYMRDDFRRGFSHLAQMGLSFDAWLLEPQLDELIDLARGFPGTSIVLDHLGGPVGRGRYAGQQDERFAIWRSRMLELAKCENVHVKLGGLGMPYAGLPSFMAEPRAGSVQLAREWRPWIESAIEIFGVKRCMFESNFPVDGASATYGTLWNAFKRICAGASADEKRYLFSDTATRFYRLTLPECVNGGRG